LKFWEKKCFLAIFFQKSIKSYIRYLFSPKRVRCTLGTFSTSVKSPDFFCTIYLFFRNFTKISDQKNRFCFYRRHFDAPQKRVKGVKRVLYVLFLKVHRLDLSHPKYWPPMINWGKVIQNGSFYTPTPQMTLVSPWLKVRQPFCFSFSFLLRLWSF